VNKRTDTFEATMCFERDIVPLGLAAFTHISTRGVRYPIQQCVIVVVSDPNDMQPRGSFGLIISATAPELAEEFVSAAADRKIRVEPNLVVVGRNNIQSRPVMFIGSRAIGQIFQGTDKQSMQLAIGAVTLVHPYTLSRSDQDADNHPDANGRNYRG
jgi:hypothetical protein